MNLKSVRRSVLYGSKDSSGNPRNLAPLYNAPVSGYTHVIEQDGKSVVSIAGWADVDEFRRRLQRFNGVERFTLLLWTLPSDMDYVEAVRAGLDGLAYIQAAGSADTLTVELRKPGGQQWGADWVRYVVGHPPAEERPRLVAPIPLPRGPEMVAQNELFGADEAADLFYSYFKTGDIPGEYSLRPVEGYTKDGGLIDLRDEVSRSV